MKKFIFFIAVFFITACASVLSAAPKDFLKFQSVGSSIDSLMTAYERSPHRAEYSIGLAEYADQILIMDSKGDRTYLRFNPFTRIIYRKSICIEETTSIKDAYDDFMRRIDTNSFIFKCYVKPDNIMGRIAILDLDSEFQTFLPMKEKREDTYCLEIYIEKRPLRYLNGYVYTVYESYVDKSLMP